MHHAGDVKLRNLKLKREALEKLNLPVTVEQGTTTMDSHEIDAAFRIPG